MKLKNTMTNQKLRGGYYTPVEISDFLTNWALETEGKSVLEPSCGDGVFITSLLKNKKNKKINEIFAIEYNKKEAKKVSHIITVHPDFKKICNVVNGDFFKFFNEKLKHKKFDIILGNPPYIRSQYFEHDQMDEALKIMELAGIKPNKLINVWAPFLIAGMLSMNNGGRLGMVIPAEMMHVNYSGDVRLFLSKFPAKITIITFNELVFPDVQQEIILVLIEKDKNQNDSQNKVFNHKINIIQIKNMDFLKNIKNKNIEESEYKKIEPTEDKWNRYLLSKQELKVLTSISDLEKLSRFGEIAKVDVGTVTGANNYFVVSEDTLKEYKLEKIAAPLVGRNLHIPGIIFDEKDWFENKKKGFAVHLLNFPNTDFENYPKIMQEYIRLGEKQEIHKRYKTRMRDRWYQVPSIWKPDAFLLRRSHRFPKLILNEANANTIDTMHRVKMNPGIDRDSLIFCFYNSVTMAYSELVGRSYGGGVLEILPNEAETMLIPYTKCKKRDLLHIEKLFRADSEIEEILDYVDDIVLKQKFDFSDQTIGTFRDIWKKLALKRLNKKKLTRVYA